MKNKKSQTQSAKQVLRKQHKGPKRHLFHELKPLDREIAKAGLLSKYSCYESWCLACSARGKKNTSKAEFSKFVILKTKAEKDKYFAELKQ